MPIDINYDEFGKPKTVLLSYQEYQDLLARPDERAIVSQTASKISELIQQFARDEEARDSDADSSTVVEPPVGDFTPTEPRTGEEQRPAPVDVRRYKNATGHYEDAGFRILKGSKASGYPSPSFEGLEAAMRLRNHLIEVGILARDGDWGDYTFTQDYFFNSPSAAACIVDGNSRSGPAAWGPRRF